MADCDPLWTDMPAVLAEKWYDFFPVGNRCIETQINSFVRFGIYLAFALCVIKRSVLFLLVIPLVAIVSVVVSKTVKEGFVGSGATVSLIPSKQPTEENPFMNLMLPDITKSPPDAAADVSPQTTSQIDKVFTDRAWANPEDVFNHTQSQRAYVTQPSTTSPSDREAFMRFTYSGMLAPTCKERNLFGAAAMCGLDRATQGLTPYAA